MRLRRQSLAKGFTLLEVLIALAILAISAMAISRQIANGHQQQQQLVEKTTAMLVAENELAGIMLQDSWPPLGTTVVSTQWGGLEWQINRVVESTSEPLLRQITIKVSVDADSIERIELIGFRGRY